MPVRPASDLGMVRNDFRFLLFAFLLSLLAVFPCLARYSGGEGTAGQPYLIYTAADMNEIGAYSADWSKYFALMAEIDLGGFTGEQFNLIGTSIKPFTGVFDGRGHTISNFTYAGNGTSYQIGLFRVVDGAQAVIKNLGLNNPDVSGFIMVSALAAFIDEGRIENCWVTGGLITADAWRAGGLAGEINTGTILNCHTSDTIVDSVSRVGGLAGVNTNGSVIKSFAANTVAGLGSNTGAFIGEGSGGFYAGCFYDSQANPSLTGLGDDSDPYGLTGETTANLMLGETFIIAGWDIVTPDNQPVWNIWRMCEDGVDYPRLSAEYSDADFACPDGIDLYDLRIFGYEWMEDLLAADVDFNLDGQVDLFDWAIFAAAWQTTTDSEDYNPLVDISPQWGDGVIDEYDSAVFVGCWLDEGLVHLNADIEPYGGDGDVDLADFAKFANMWLEEK